jgi:drug/metabolite transporter (DMT)-like permease
MGLPVLSLFLGLACAVTWGISDFTGGVVTKRTNVYGVLIIGHIGSLLLLVVSALLFRESLPPMSDMLIGMLTGISGGIGLLLLYRSLADGQMSLASPLAALVGASVPVLVGVWTDGLPAPLVLLGFALALAAIWLIAQTGHIDRAESFRNLLKPALAGVTFGIFFVGLHYASGTAVLWPMAATRMGSIPAVILYCRLRGIKWLPERRLWRNISLISVLDTAGNLFYMLAARFGRMDVAAVVSSLYPASTVALARILLKEKISAWQWVGILLALVALVLISL